MAATGDSNIGQLPISISLNSPLHCHHLPQSPLMSDTMRNQRHITSSSSTISASGNGAPGLAISGHGGGGSALRDNQAPIAGDLSSIFSIVLNRQQHQNHHNNNPLTQQPHHVRWPSFSIGNRSLWTKYCLLCTVCGSAATILAGIFLVISALFRHYTTSCHYFETIPTYIPAVTLSICGISTIAFSCKRNRNIILLRITACWSLCSAALSSIITITTSLIHMNRLQTLKECVYTKNPPQPPSCTCYSQSFGMQGPSGPEISHYIFENTPDCDVIHGILYSCLRAVFAISVVAVLLSIFLCMLLYQLIGHERKKAYWSRIRRINSDWSADFIACLARPIPRERSSLLPLMPTLMPGTGTVPVHGPSILPPPGWGPPPSYDDACSGDSDRPSRHLTGQRSGLCGSSIQPTHSFAGVSSGGFTGGGYFNNRSSASFAFHGGHHPPTRRLRLVTSHSENSFRNVTNNSDGLMYPHPFSPTITSIDPASIFKQQSQHHLNQSHQRGSYFNHPNNQNNTHHYHHHNRHHNNPSGSCNIMHNNHQNNDNYLQGNREAEMVGLGPPMNQSSSNGRRNFRSLSQLQVLQRSTEEDEEECCRSHVCQLPQSSSFLTNPSGRDSEFSITSLSMPDNSSMSVTMKSSTEIPFVNDNSNNGCSNCSNMNRGTSDSLVEETGFISDQEISCASYGTTSAAEAATTTTSATKKLQSLPPTTASSEPKMITANQNNSLSTFASQMASNANVINSDTDIILNKKVLESWGSLKKHKNFSYYGSSGNSTSRRKRKDKNKSSLSKISSLPCSPFLNMKRKLFGPGGKSLECVQNLNYNFSCNIVPAEAVVVLGKNTSKSNNPLTTSSDEFKDDKVMGKRKKSNESCKSAAVVVSESQQNTSNNNSHVQCLEIGGGEEERVENRSVVEIRPETVT